MHVASHQLRPVPPRRVAARQLQWRHPDLRRATLAAGDGQVGVKDEDGVEGAVRIVREHGRRACG